MRQIIEMPGVVAFVLELHAVALRERLVDLLDVEEGVGKDVAVGIEQIALLPVRISSSL